MQRTDAQEQARKEAELEAKETAAELRSSLEADAAEQRARVEEAATAQKTRLEDETRQRNSRLEGDERRLKDRAEELDRRATRAERREDDLQRREAQISESRAAADAAREEADKLKSDGKKPYIIPPGGTAELGVIAYAHAALELKTQCDEMGLNPDAAVITVGSGSTHAGLVLGARGHGLGYPVLGISISASTEDCEPDARELIADACTHLDIDDPTVESDVRILDDYVGGGYGIAGSETYEFIADIGARSGVICDPVYTGKALQGTVAEMTSGCLQDAKDVIFVHTGGVFGIYQKKRGFDLEDWRTI